MAGIVVYKPSHIGVKVGCWKSVGKTASNADVLKRIGEKELLTIQQRNITTETRLCWTLCYNGGSVGRISLIILEGKIKGKKQQVGRRECGLPTPGNKQCWKITVKLNDRITRRSGLMCWTTLFNKDYTVSQ